MLLLAEALDIDTYAWVAPRDDVDLSKDPLPTRFMPLRFRKHAHAHLPSKHKLYVRFRDNHFTVYRPQPADKTVNPGPGADENHYLDGGFDVATGRYVVLAVVWCGLLRCGAVQCLGPAVVWCGLVQCGVFRCGVVRLPGVGGCHDRKRSHSLQPCHCRPLKSLDERQADEEKALALVTGGAEGKPGILSWTFGQQTKDLSADAQAAFVRLLRHLHEKTALFTDGAAAVERGGKHFNLHLQCMLWCPKLGSDRATVNEGASQLLYNCAGMPRGQKYHCFVEVHWPGTQPYVYWRTMLGYDPSAECTIQLCMKVWCVAGTVWCGAVRWCVLFPCNRKPGLFVQV